jgi:hypothetical protein
LVVLIMVILGKSFGLAGVLAAPPLAAALQIALTSLLSPAGLTAAAQPQSVSGDYEALTAQFSALRAALATGSSAPESEVLNLADRLETLLEQAGETLATEAQPA